MGKPCLLSGIVARLSDFLISFLDLMASSPESFFVPTLDIDLAWHTHQLKSTGAYNRDCLLYVKRFVDQ
jgi:hypothetical protein